MNDKMSPKERIIHTLLYEFFAVLLTVVVTVLLTRHDSVTLTSLMLLLSLTAMVWNVLFNWLFDQVVKGERIQRGLGIRIAHSVLFEGGLMIFSLPLVMWVLQIGWWEALVMDVGMTLFVLVYSVAFNWIYDHLRLKFI